jgi:broad specificity phosphatase PhoE
MVNIFLVRHGEAAAAWGEDPDPGLSELGHKQAVQVRDELQGYDSLQVISSPLKRAQETALPLATKLQARVLTEDAFREIPSPVGIDDRQAWLAGFMKQQWSEQGPEILAWRDSAWNRLFELDEDTVIFSHFMIINAICCRLTESAATICCVPDNGSIVHLRLEEDSLELVNMGRQQQTIVN